MGNEGIPFDESDELPPFEPIRRRFEENLTRGVDSDGLPPEQHVFHEGQGGGIVFANVLRRSIHSVLGGSPKLRSSTLRRGPIHSHSGNGDDSELSDMVNADYTPEDYSPLEQLRRLSHELRLKRKYRHR